MQFKINTLGVAPDLDAIEQAITAADPSAVVDLDASGSVLRISTVMGDAELIGTLQQGGYAVPLPRLERVPSECCGGCGG